MAVKFSLQALKDAAKYHDEEGREGTATALRQAVDEIERLRDALKQARTLFEDDEGIAGVIDRALEHN